MNVKTTVVLLVLLAGSLAYVLVRCTGLVDTPPAPPPATADVRLFPGLGAIDRLEVRRPGQPDIVLVRGNDDWSVTAPFQAPAPRGDIESMVSQFVCLTHLGKLSPTSTDFPRHSTGLDQPRATVVLTDRAGQRRELKIGQNIPLDPLKTYAAVAGDQSVYVIASNIVTMLDKKPEAYHRRDVANFSLAAAVGVEVSGQENYRVVKGDDGVWLLEKPAAVRANQAAVNNIIQKLTCLWIGGGFIDQPGDLAKYGLDNPLLTLRVEVKPEASTVPSAPTVSATAAANQIITLHFSAPAQDTVFVHREGFSYLFPLTIAQVAELTPKFSDVQDHRVLDCFIQDIFGIDICLGDAATASLEKVDGRWRMRKPFEGDCEPQPVADLLGALDKLEADRFENGLADHGLAPAQGKIVLRVREVRSRSDKVTFVGTAPATTTERTIVLPLGAMGSNGQKAYVQIPDSQRVGVVDAQHVATLRRPAETYRARLVWELPKGNKIVRVQIERPSGNIVLARDSTGHMRMTAPIVSAGDDANAYVLLTALSSIKADVISDIGPRLPERLANHAATTVIVSFAPQNESDDTPGATHSPLDTPTVRPSFPKEQSVSFLVFTDRDKTYLWRKAPGLVTVAQLPASFGQALEAELRDRTVLPLDPAKVTGLKLTVSGAELELKRTPDGWQSLQDPMVKIDPKLVQDYLETLQALKAARFVDYSEQPDLKTYGLSAADKPRLVLELQGNKSRLWRLAVAQNGPAGMEGRYAQSSEVAAVFVLPAEIAKALEKSLGDFRLQAKAGDQPADADPRDK